MRYLILMAGLSLAACSPAPSETANAPAPAATPMISEADAIAMLNKVPAALIAGDVEGAVGLFTPNAVLVDMSSNDLITTKEANLAATSEFLKAGVSKLLVNSQTAQVLDADTAVVTSIMTGEMSGGGTPSQMTFRVTDVLEKQADGKWLIVNEHASQAPQPVTEPLPVIGTIPPQ